MSGIFRVKKNANYFTASNEPFNDKNLSWEARGVLGYLLSKVDGWEVRDNDLINQGPAGGAKINRILDELKAHGYLRRFRERKPDGTFEWATEVYESPKLNPDATDPKLKEWAEGKRQRIEAKRKRAYERQKQKKTIGVLYPNGDINEGTIGVLSTSGLSTSGESPYIVNTELSSTELVNTKTTTVDSDFSKICKLYESEIGFLSPLISDTIKDDIKTYPVNWIEQAIGIATAGNKRNWRYVQGILKNWKAQGGPQNDKPKARNNGHETHYKKPTVDLEAYRHLEAQNQPPVDTG